MCLYSPISPVTSQPLCMDIGEIQTKKRKGNQSIISIFAKHFYISCIVFFSFEVLNNKNISQHFLQRVQNNRFNDNWQKVSEHWTSLIFIITLGYQLFWFFYGYVSYFDSDLVWGIQLIIILDKIFVLCVCVCI